MGVAVIRSMLIYLLVLGGVRLMGKRQIGELQPFELVVMMMISDLASIPMQDVSVPLIVGLIPLVTVVAMEVILSAAVMKRYRLRRFVTGNPMALIKNGKVDQDILHRVNFTLDDLLESLRLAGYSDPSDVDFAVLETNGDLSFFTKQDAPGGIFVPLICDGEVMTNNLLFYGKTREWLTRELSSRQLTKEDVFLLTADRDGQVRLVIKQKEKTRRKGAFGEKN